MAISNFGERWNGRWCWDAESAQRLPRGRLNAAKPPWRSAAPSLGTKGGIDCRQLAPAWLPLLGQAPFVPPPHGLCGHCCCYHNKQYINASLAAWFRAAACCFVRPGL